MECEYTLEAKRSEDLAETLEEMMRANANFIIIVMCGAIRKWCGRH
jgi:hypothetical protein